MKKIIVGLFFLILVFAGANFGVNAIKNADNKSVLPAVTVNNSSGEVDEPEDAKPLPGVPQTLRIPKINVDTTIESVGLDSSRKMGVPEDSDNVAWYNLGPRPGADGSAVLAGHKDEASGAPSVFWDLKKLQAGDELIITDSEGNERTFLVTGIEEYPDANFPLQKVFSSSGKPILNLITCEGVFNQATRNYSHRTVVYSELAE